MNLIEESYIEKQQRPKKIKKMVLIVITILVLAIIVIISLLVALREKPLTATIDGTPNGDILKVLKIQDDGTVYIPIKQFASFVGYEAYNGEYEAKSEEQNKCYVQSEFEAVNLSLNNERIYQLDLSTNRDEDYRYYDMKEEVKSIDGELCIKADELEQVFNTKLTYDEQENTITIQTLPYLVQQKNTEVLNYGYEAIDETFSNQKAILSDMLIVTKNNKKIVGILDAKTGEILVEPKYTSIKYLPNIGDCIVEDNKKYGVVSPKETKKTKIQVNYDSIDLVDKDAGLYVVEKDRKYGIVDLKGNQIAPVEYDQIGIDKSNFKENSIDNKYLLVNNLIPMKKGDLWGMLDKKGSVIVQPVFDSYGYVATNNKNAINMLVVPEYEVIVVCKNKKYGLMNKTGDRILDVVADDIFMTYENGEYKYWINANDSLRDLTLYLDQVSGINTQNTATSDQNQEEQQEQQTQQEQQAQEQEQQTQPQEQQVEQEQPQEQPQEQQQAE